MSDVLTATVLTHVERLSEESLIGMTIADVRLEFGDVLNILADATPYVNGQALDDSHVIEAGERIVFSLSTGEKG